MDESKSFKGRGATRNPKSRYLDTTAIPVDDGWDQVSFSDENFPDSAPATKLFPDKTRNIITTNSSPDIPFEQSINP